MKRRRWNIFSNTSPLKSSDAPRAGRSWRTAHQPKACTPSIETPSHDALARMAKDRQPGLTIRIGLHDPLARMATTGDVVNRVREFNSQRAGHGRPVSRLDFQDSY